MTYNIEEQDHEHIRSLAFACTSKLTKYAKAQHTDVLRTRQFLNRVRSRLVYAANGQISGIIKEEKEEVV